MGGKSIGGALISEDGGRKSNFGRSAEPCGAESRVEPVVFNLLVGLDDHIVALTDGQEEAVLDDGLDGHEIGSDDSEAVASQRDSESVVNSGVDQSEAMLLARRKLRLLVLAAAQSINALSVEKNVLAVWRRAG